MSRTDSRWKISFKSLIDKNSMKSWKVKTSGSMYTLLNTKRYIHKSLNESIQ